MKYFWSIFFLSIFISCGVKPNGDFRPDATPPPNYEDFSFWAAHPLKEDPSDQTPSSSLKPSTDKEKVDVFFVHPTTYTGDKNQNLWNAPADDLELNKKTDSGTILFQASSFNGSGNIYAPYYRQAHLHSYYTKKKRLADKAFELAYQDVKKAFFHYIENWNDDKPLILASHSQGTTHLGRLVKEEIEGTDLEEKIIVMYLIGMPVPDNYFENFKACETAEETGCYCSWRSYKRNFYPKSLGKVENIVVTNPLSWQTNTTYVAKEKNRGTVLLDFEDGIFPKLADAQVHKDVLWVTKPKFKGSIFLTFRNYHIADYNLFYGNIYYNAQLRTQKFLERNQ